MLRPILILAIAGMCHAQTISEFVGTWVLKVDGQSIFKLSLREEGGRITGSLTKPKELSIDQDGNITGIGPVQISIPVREAALKPRRLELMIDEDRFVMTSENHDEAILELQGMRPWRLERVPDGRAVVLATKLMEPDYPKEIRRLREHLRTMVNEDQNARLAFDEARTQAADSKNRSEVLQIFERHGWVTNSLAGKDAARNFALLVQHQTIEIQRRLLPALEKAAKAGDASIGDYAYLYDRVQVGDDKPQHWGTQAKCENGKPVLSPVDDLAGLDERRRALFMIPIREYLSADYLVKLCARSGHQ